MLTWLLGMGVVGLVGWLFWPGGVSVEVGEVGRGGMEVVVAAEGRTRVKDRYVVSAPLAARLGRIGLKPGDRVEAGRTVLAVLVATPVELLNARSRAEAVAQERAAEFAGRVAEFEWAQARAALEFTDPIGPAKQAMTLGGSRSVPRLMGWFSGCLSRATP